MDEGQERGIGNAIAYLQEKYFKDQLSIAEIIQAVEADIEGKSLDALTRSPSGELVRFRPYELAAGLNRLRSLDIQRP